MFSGTTSQTTRATLTTSPLTKASQKLALGCALTAAGEAFLTSQVFAKIILAPSSRVFFSAASNQMTIVWRAGDSSDAERAGFTGWWIEWES